MNQELSLEHTESIDQNKILTQVIKLEYQARQDNKALLLRGSNQIELIPYSDKYNEKLPILGSTLQRWNTEKSLLDETSQLYTSKKLSAYSIAFGNSLFAGYANDPCACAYVYFYHHNGYGLFINKKDQIQHQSNNLFFISPLASIAALFAKGEIFHSRTKITSPQTNQNVYGLVRPNIYTKNALSIHRNPLRHAQLFSQYLADNMVIIATPGYQTPDLSPEEQAIYDQKRMEESNQLRANQAKAADYYEAIKKLDDHFPVATANFQKRENKNVSQQMRNLRFNKDMQKLIDARTTMEQEIQKIEEKHGQISIEEE